MERHAAEAALSYIKDHMTIGLGSGKAVDYLVEFINMRNIPGLKVATNSMATALKAKKNGLDVVPVWTVSHLDYTFDSLDFVDKDLNGAKSAPSMIVENKLLASMADKFVVFVSEDKFAQILTDGLAVEVEVIKPAFSYVTKCLENMHASVYNTDKNTGEPFVSTSGNYVLHANFTKYDSLKDLNEKISTIPGVISTSLFTGLNTVALVYNGHEVQTIEG